LGDVLTVVPQPASVRVHTHVTPVLVVPVAALRTHPRATIRLNLGDTVVSQPAAFPGRTSVAVDLSAVALLGVRFKVTGRARAIVIASVVIEARTCRASTRALVLAIVAQPAVVAVHPHVAPILSFPVAIFVANTRAAVL